MEVSESRDTASTTEKTLLGGGSDQGVASATVQHNGKPPPSTKLPSSSRSPTSQRTTLMKHSPAGSPLQIHRRLQMTSESALGPYPPHPHSPRQQYGMSTSSSRGRAHSMGTLPEPLLVPQIPPTSFGNGRAMSLSPYAKKQNVPIVPGLHHGIEPPRHSPLEARKIEEHAIQAERMRTKELEKQEVDMTANELRAVLKKERHRMARMAGDLAKIKNAAVQCQADSEVMEEGRINGLMRRLENMQIEKGRIILELEREEEMVRKSLTKSPSLGKSNIDSVILNLTLTFYSCIITLFILHDPCTSTNDNS